MSDLDKVASALLRSKNRGKAFDAITEQVYAAILKPGHATVDGGANKGRHTLPMARCVGPDGLVLAFEPIPLLARNLEARLAQEQINNTNVIEAALSDTAGMAKFTYVTNHPAYSGLALRDYPFEPTIEYLDVKTVLMDAYLPADRPLSFIKLDLEGGEFRALRGAEHILRQKRPVIEFENGKASPAAVYGYSADDFFAYFEGVDYRLFDIFGRSFGPSLWSTRGGAWNFFAVPRERVEEIELVLPSIVAEAAANYGEHPA